MLKIGVTGGIGSGKSKVCEILEAMGFPVFYSDIEAKAIVNHNPDVKNELRALFGEAVYQNGELNRPFLASKIFGDDDLRDKVNTIIHPRVREAFDAFCSKQNASLVFNEAAILIETGAAKKMDRTLLVTAPENVRVERVRMRDGVSEQDVRARMNKQWSDDRKTQFADFVITNDGQLPLVVQVEEAVHYFTSSQGS